MADTTEQSGVPSKKNVVNLTGGVETEGGRTLYGFDAELYLRMKAKEDPELERRVGEWIEDVVGHEIEDPCNLWKSLKSGVVLVELINTIAPKTIVKYNKKDKLHVLMERENISLYLEGCWKLGLSADYMFLPPDLHSRTNIAAVINNLIALSDIANYFGNVRVISLRTGEIPQENKHVVNVQNATGQSPPPSPQKAKSVKKWTVPVYTGPTYVEQLGGNDDPEFVLTQLKKELENCYQKIATLEYSNTTLKDDLKEARRKNREIGVTSTTVPGDPDLLEQIRKLKQEKIKLMGENEMLRKSARMRAGVSGPSDPQQKVINACKELQRLIQCIMNPDHQVRKEHCLFLEDWFKTEDAMRRTFAAVLRETLFDKNKGEEVELTSLSFDALVYLIEILLDNSNPTNGADVISGKYILQCSYLVFRKPSIFTKDWCQDFIKKHKFWTNNVFWQEYFWDRMARKFPDSTPETNVLLFQELKNFAPSIAPWGETTEESVLELFRSIYKRIDLVGEAKPDDKELDRVEKEVVEMTRKQKNYIRSSTGLNIRNVLWGVAAQHIEAPLADLKTEFTSSTSVRSLSSSSVKREVAEQAKAEQTKATPKSTTASPKPTNLANSKPGQKTLNPPPRK